MARVRTNTSSSPSMIRSNRRRLSLMVAKRSRFRRTMALSNSETSIYIVENNFHNIRRPANKRFRLQDTICYALS